jgi:hypothetical protein
MNQGIDTLLARQILVKLQQRDPDDDAGAGDDEDQVRAARDVWPEKDAKQDVEYKGGKEAAPGCESALERGAAGGRGSRWNVVIYLIVHVDVVWDCSTVGSTQCLKNRVESKTGKDNDGEENDSREWKGLSAV